MNYALIFCFSLILALSAFVGNAVFRTSVEYHLQSQSREELESKLIDGVEVNFDHLTAEVVLDSATHADVPLVLSVIDQLPGAYVSPDRVTVKPTTRPVPHPPKRLDIPPDQPQSSLEVTRVDKNEFQFVGTLPDKKLTQQLRAVLLETFPDASFKDLVIYDTAAETPTWQTHSTRSIPLFLGQTEGPTSMAYGPDTLQIKFTPDTKTQRERITASLLDGLPSSHRLEIVPREPSNTPPRTIPAAVTIAESLDGTRIEITGLIHDEATLLIIDEMLKAVAPKATLVNRLKISPEVISPDWISTLSDLVPRHLTSVEQGIITFKGNSIRISGSTKSRTYYDQVENLLRKLRERDFAVTNHMVLDEAPPPPSAATAPQKTNESPKPDLKTDAQRLNEQLARHPIFFASGSSRISPDQLPTLREIADLVSISADKASTLLVGGYADKKGDAESNRKLSLRRANNVRDQLIRNGISSERLRAQVFGEDPKAEDSDSPESRRVELRVLPKP